MEQAKVNYDSHVDTIQRKGAMSISCNLGKMEEKYYNSVDYFNVNVVLIRPVTIAQADKANALSDQFAALSGANT